MNEKLLETIADISYCAGQRGFFSGDSRADVSAFIWWAIEFENLYKNTNWDQEDNAQAVEAYAMDKLLCAAS